MMNRTSFSLELFGDRFPWMTRDISAGDNRRYLQHMKAALHNAMKNELTDHQQYLVECYYFSGMTVTQIAKNEGVNKSTVSRQLKRSREKLGHTLKYGLFPIWSEDFSY
jgi:RNA polymerase sigma factor (sigma-70 family)